MPVTAPAATNGIRLVGGLVAVGCTLFNSPLETLPSEVGNRVFFVRVFRAPRLLQRYHYYFSDDMRQTSDTSQSL